MSRRTPASCWSCLNPSAAPITHPGMCDRCAQLADATRPADADDLCLRCGRESLGALCDPCSDAPDVWAMLTAEGTC